MKKINILLVVIAVLLALSLMVMHTSTAQKIQRSIMDLMSPFQKTSSAVQQGIGAMGKGLKSLDELEDENDRLEGDNKKLLASNQILKDMEIENNKLREALGYRDRSIFQLVPAQLIARDASTWWSSVTINRGFEDGVDDGSQGGNPMTVITDVGVVGKVMTAGKNDSKVVLITDENCKIGAYVEGTREKGIVTGIRVQEGGNAELQMNFLSRNAALKPGQKVYTQGVGAVFPPGLLIGTVKSFKSRELDGQAILDPAVDFTTLGDMFRHHRIKMKGALSTLGLVVAIFLSFVIQESIPPIWAANGARIYLVPVLFCYGACVLPFYGMIALAVTSGFLSDFYSLQVLRDATASTDMDAIHTVLSSVEISPGWSILLFVALGSICQGLRPLVLRGHWWLPALMSALTTIVYLALQFLMITMRRFDSGGLFWSETVAWRILVPGLLASLLTMILVLGVMLADTLFFAGRRDLRDF